MDTRRMRLVVAVRGVSAVNIRRLGNDLAVLKEKCKTMQLETSLLLLKPNVDLVVEMAAMDEVIDHYGQQTVYVLLSPYADYQREFFDRVRINSIRHFQVDETSLKILNINVLQYFRYLCPFLLQNFPRNLFMLTKSSLKEIMIITNPLIKGSH